MLSACILKKYELYLMSSVCNFFLKITGVITQNVPALTHGQSVRLGQKLYVLCVQCMARDMRGLCRFKAVL